MAQILPNSLKSNLFSVAKKCRNLHGDTLTPFCYHRHRFFTLSNPKKCHLFSQGQNFLYCQNIQCTMRMSLKTINLSRKLICFWVSLVWYINSHFSGILKWVFEVPDFSFGNKCEEIQAKIPASTLRSATLLPPNPQMWSFLLEPAFLWAVQSQSVLSGSTKSPSLQDACLTGGWPTVSTASFGCLALSNLLQCLTVVSKSILRVYIGAYFRTSNHGEG